MTDVSPLTSPDVQQRIKAKSRGFADGHPDDMPVRHITKLNVVFKNNAVKSSDPVKQKKNQRKSSHHRFDYQTVQWSSSDSDDDLDNYTNGHNYHNADLSDKKYQTHKVRQDHAALNHRQRLLDSAARGSMDVSSLLETVLEFEKHNYDRKNNPSIEAPMNYHLGEKLLQDHDRRQRKNMSFTNDKVREIDQENRRLLDKIRNQSRPSSASSVRSSRSTRSAVSGCSRQSSASSRPGSSRRRDADKPMKLYHSAVNRLQYQRRIERENMQLLKRLQTARPTPGLQRQQQLSQYKQQSDYMGTTINRNGMSIQRANELTRNAEVVQKAMGLSKRSKPVRPAWEEKW